jgi:hypothetical protein
MQLLSKLVRAHLPKTSLANGLRAEPLIPRPQQTPGLPKCEELRRYSERFTELVVHDCLAAHPRAPNGDTAHYRNVE